MSKTTGPNPKITEEAIRILEAASAKGILVRLPGRVENSTRRRVTTYAALILFAGTFGWTAEIIYHVIVGRRPYRQSYFKRIPFGPLYALAGAITLALAQALQGRNVLVKILVYYMVLNGLEYLAGALILKLTSKRVWNYAKHGPLHLHGHVDLGHSITWTGLAMLFDRVFYPRLAGHLQ
jgi:uncharacterized membrane protein